MTNQEVILEFLLNQGLTVQGTFGLMGNIKAESGFIPNNMQNSYEGKYNDATYTWAVDNGTYTKFDSDGIGYGICQWTFGARKRGLLKLARARSTSVGDLETQLIYLTQEMQKSFSSVWLLLKTTTSLKIASDAVLMNFERPANAEAKKGARYALGKEMFEAYMAGTTTKQQTKYTNSPLVVYTKLSPNHSGLRNHDIDTISIHCMAGNLSVETCGNLFSNPNREASSNYGIGSDGRIALYVEEKNRSWCTSSASNDHRAITIEVANSAGAPDWPVSEKAYAALLDLLVDICQRNKIKQLLWRGDKGLIGQINLQNMTVHRWFAAKACPGNYLFNRHAAIASEINKRLKGAEPDLSRDEVIQIVNETLSKRNPLYPDIKDVPKYWQPAIQEFLDLDILNGGTPRSVNATDVNLSQDTVKALVLLRAYIDTLIPRKE